VLLAHASCFKELRRHLQQQRYNRGNRRFKQYLHRRPPASRAQRASSGARRLRRVPLERLVGREVFDEVKTCHGHAFTLIETMCIFSLNT